MFDRGCLFVLVGYMNLPRSAVTPTLPKNSSGAAVSPDPHQSDYMNLEPKDTHIYQNTSILNIPSGTPGLVGPDSEIETSNRRLGSTASRLDSDTDGRESSSSPDSTRSSSEPSSTSQSNDGSLDDDQSSDSNGANDQQVHISNNSPFKPRPTGPRSETKSADTTQDPNSNDTSGNSSKFYSRSANDTVSSAAALSPRRREGMADSSFVERKYGLIFTDDYPGCQNETKTSDISRNSQTSRNL